MWAFLLSLLSKVPGLLAGPVSRFVTGINIGQVFSGIVNNIKAHWHIYLSTFLVVLQLSTLYGCNYEHNLLTKEKAAHQLDITDFKKAQVEADAKAQAEKVTLQKESKADADQADARYSTLLAEYRANLLRYEAGQSGTSKANHNQLPPAPSGNGSSTGSDLPAGQVTISVDDAQVCAVNTARLQAVHDWAIDLLKDEPQ